MKDLIIGDVVRNKEIKFRGKSLKSDKWVYGELKEDGDTSHVNGCRVDPNTVGQYTGVNDKNGTEIYEGDIVSSGATTGIVIYDCEKAGFMVQKEQCIELRFYSLLGIEVIGNIHDNNKLIEQ